jgi:enoyl-CoA hydratase/carnithine racemase
MSDVRIDHQGPLLVVTLERGKANALNAAMVEELRRVVEMAATDTQVRGLVLASASQRVFCAGFDVAEVFAYDRNTMTRFFGAFADLFERVRTLPKPVVAAMSGHAYAGGAILALAADVRVMADGSCFAINEIDLGVILPTRMIHAMVQHMRRDVMRALLLGGEAINATKALAAGVVTEVVPPIDVLPVALTRARQLADKPAHAYAAHKQTLETLGAPLSEAERQAELARVVEVWFGEEATARRQALTDKLMTKGGA